MMRPLSLLVIASLALGACGLRESRVNPFNWFGNSNSEPAPAPDPEAVNPLIPTRSSLFGNGREERDAAYRGTPVDVISDLAVERVPGGAIVRVTGTGRVKGLYDVRLTPENDGEAVDGVLSWRLDALRPAQPLPGGSEATRRVTAAVAVTDQDLRGVSTIRVSGLENARTSRRR